MTGSPSSELANTPPPPWHTLLEGGHLGSGTSTAGAEETTCQPPPAPAASCPVSAAESTEQSPKAETSRGAGRFGVTPVTHLASGLGTTSATSLPPDAKVKSNRSLLHPSQSVCIPSSYEMFLIRLYCYTKAVQMLPKDSSIGNFGHTTAGLLCALRVPALDLLPFRREAEYCVQ